MGLAIGNSDECKNESLYGYGTHLLPESFIHLDKLGYIQDVNGFPIKIIKYTKM